MLNPVAHERRQRYLGWLLEITQIPTAAGREWRVVEWVRRWVNERPELALTADPSGNLVVAPGRPWGASDGAKPIFITAHLDHPAFVVERIVAPGVVEVAFRGGVMDPYFEKARIVIFAGGRDGVPETRIGATITGAAQAGGPLGKSYLADVDDGEAAADTVRVGDVGGWALPPAEIDAQNVAHTNACDDLAAVAASLCAMDALCELRRLGQKTEDVRLLFTRAEEIGFVGAIAACKHRTMPAGSRVIALENSRSFIDSPIGGGPIVRVGDRMSIFDPRLTAACAKRAEEISGHASLPTARQTAKEMQGWKWQRKLMAGGACEATVFCAFGYAATCLCLPLGNYHNMADLAEVQDGSYDRAARGSPRAGREFIHTDDFLGLVDLLIAIGQSLPEGDPAVPRLESMYSTRSFVLNEV